MLIAAVYIGGVGIAQVAMQDKETKDWTGTHQGETDTIYDVIMSTSATVDTLLVICDRIMWKLDEVKRTKEMDSVDNYHRYWYEVLDTNSDGDIDNDSVIEWLEE